jgi:RimJ/RimL family protein N-acetyltransferase
MALHHPPGLPGIPAAGADWRQALPELRTGRDTLRELRLDDAISVLHQLNRPAVLRFISPCPTTEDGFRRFIRWTHAQRRQGALACYGIVPEGLADAVGFIQIWRIERDFSTAEIGFALGEAFWGTGLFVRAVALVLDTVFSRMGVHRVEARAVDINVRGNGVLAKLGAKRDGVMRSGFRDGEIFRDHIMWSILAPEWRARRASGSHAD